MSDVQNPRKGFKSTKHKFLETNKYGKIVITLSFIITIGAIAFVVVDTFITNNLSNEVLASEVEVMEKLLDSQSITLAITAISISLISIICAIFSIDREQKFDKLKENIEAENNKIEDRYEKMRETIDSVTKKYEETQIALNNYQNLFEENSTYFEMLVLVNSMFLNKRKESLLQEINDFSDFPLLKYMYIKTLHEQIKTNATEDEKLHFYETIISYAEKYSAELKLNKGYNEYEKTRLYSLYLMIGDAYYYYAISFIENSKSIEDNELQSLFSKAEKYLKNAKDLYKEDEDGYIENSFGLICYWKYQNTLKRSLPIDISKLKDSINHYLLAIQKCNYIAHYYNNLGVSYLQLANYDDNKEKFNDLATQAFKTALRLDNKGTKAAINIAEIEIKKIREELGVEKEILILYEKKENLKLTEDTIKELNKSFEIGKKYFNYAAEYNLYFPNVYYKKAQLLIYHLLYNHKLCDKEEAEIKSEIEELLKTAKYINNTAQGTLFIERMYYDVTGNFVEARRINEKVREFNSKNAENWENAYNEYTNGGSGTNSIEYDFLQK